VNRPFRAAPVIDDGEQLLRPLRAARTPLLDLVGPTPYAGFQSLPDSTVVHGWHYYWKATHLHELSDDLIDVITEHAFSCSSPRSYVALFNPTGTVSRVAEGDTSSAATKTPTGSARRTATPSTTGWSG
jgi:hypothetical protein